MSVSPDEQSTDSERYDDGQPEVPSGGPGVGPEAAPPDDYDTGPRPEDGDQDVDQYPDFESAESDDNQDADDPEVHEV
jgi:hypothetical protein